MIASDVIILRELPVIQKIIHDETWLEAERRGYFVSSKDQVVRENVCRVVLRVGAQLRELSLRAVDSGVAENCLPDLPEAA